VSVEAAAPPGAEIADERQQPSAPGGIEPPRWLRVAAFVPAAAVLALGSTGLVLAVNGWYRPALAYSLGGAVWIALVALARPVLGPARSAAPNDSRAPSSTPVRAAHVYAAIGVAAIVAITAWNMANSSQHALVDRDGGSYTNTGRWIAREGSLDVEPRVGPFAHDPTVGFGSLAVFEMPDGSLQFQFAHFLPVVLAEAYAVGGNFGLFHAPELLGGFALLAFFVLAWRLFRRPLFALSAMLALAFMLPEVSFSRDSYSEIPSQILLFTALWVLVSPRVLPRWRLALVGGLFLGALEATRIDAIVFLIGVPVVCLVAWLRTGGDDRRRVALPSIVAFVAGIVPGMALGLVDLMRHSGEYYADLADNVRTLRLLTEASLVFCVVFAVGWRFVSPFLRSLPWRRIAAGAAGLVAVVGFGAWAFRPRLQHLRGKDGAIVGLQQVEHVAVDATRLYGERSLSWMAWYLGPLTLAVAIVGAALLVRALLLGQMTRVIAALAVITPGSALYLYRASAVPDHVWVTRRFLLGAFPLIVLLALGLASAVAGMGSRSDRGRPARVVARVVAVVVAVAAVAYPIHTLLPVRAMAEETGYLGVITDICAAVGPHAAVVVVEAARTDGADDWVPQPVRGWCGADVAVMRGDSQTSDLERLAKEWNAVGRRFFVVSSSLGYVQKLLPTATFTSTRRAADTQLLAPTLTHRPDAYRSQTLQLVVASVPPA
jgi:hypothetical protein